MSLAAAHVMRHIDWMLQYVLFITVHCMRGDLGSQSGLGRRPRAWLGLDFVLAAAHVMRHIDRMLQYVLIITVHGMRGDLGSESGGGGCSHTNTGHK